jgi:hypothetical protein
MTPASCPVVVVGTRPLSPAFFREAYAPRRRKPGGVMGGSAEALERFERQTAWAMLVLSLAIVPFL